MKFINFMYSPNTINSQLSLYLIVDGVFLTDSISFFIGFILFAKNVSRLMCANIPNILNILNAGRKFLIVDCC